MIGTGVNHMTGTGADPMTGTGADPMTGTGRYFPKGLIVLSSARSLLITHSVFS